MPRPLPDPNLFMLGGRDASTGGFGGVGDFASHLASILGRYRAYEHRNSMRMANEFALSGKGIYPGAPQDLAQGGVNLNYAHPDARAALISILRAGGGFIRG